MGAYITKKQCSGFSCLRRACGEKKVGQSFQGTEESRAQQGNWLTKERAGPNTEAKTAGRATDRAARWGSVEPDGGV